MAPAVDALFLVLKEGELAKQRVAAAAAAASAAAVAIGSSERKARRPVSAPMHPMVRIMTAVRPAARRATPCAAAPVQVRVVHSTC